VLPRFPTSGVDESGPRRRGLPLLLPAASDWPSAPQRARRVTLDRLRKEGDPVAAARAAGSLEEFVLRQQGLLCPRAGSGRVAAARVRWADDPRLWLDDGHWLAWTICGELVSVEEIEPGSMHGSPEVRRLAVNELPAVFAANRLIPSVIALYRGDLLDRGAVRRYMAHHDLRRALHAALARAQAVEARLRMEAAMIAAPVSSSPTSRVARAQKTRHHPLGNFIVYRPPGPDDGLPVFAAELQLTPVPEAFPDRRTATRFLERLPRLGIDPTGLVVARVVDSVEVQPVFRAGIQVPREPEAVVELIRREPRVVLPELKAAWLPRYVQAESGEWELESVQKRGTVRGRWNQVLLRQVTEEGRRVAGALEENSIRSRIGSDVLPLDQRLLSASRVAQKAERRLPSAWLDQLGMERESLGPDWSMLAAAAPVVDVGHWLRAPCEHGQPHSDGQRRRIVELRIDDLAGLMELAGLRPRFLLVKSSIKAAPHWALSLTELLMPHVHSVSSSAARGS
jgi:hypothetical protein